MKRRSLSLAVLLFLSAGITRAQVGKGLNDHSHSASGGGANGGGSTLAPRRVSMIANSTFTALGNVAIGTTTPAAGKIFTVLGGASISGALTVGSFAASTSAFTSVTATYGVSAATMTTTAGANFATVSGNVGIGTSSPGEKLESRVDAVGAASPALLISNRATPTIGNTASIALGPYSSSYTAEIKAVAETAAAATGLAFWTHDGGAYTEKLRINRTGSVGIGTTNPGRLLAVDAGAGAYISSFSSLGNTAQIYADSSGPYIFSGGGTLAAGGGMIGLGTPTNKSVYLGAAGSTLFTLDGVLGAITQMPKISSQIVTVDGTAAGINLDQGFIAHGGKSVSPLNTGEGIWAKSIDGATQSSGCVVAVKFADGGLPSDVPTFTSTTTSPIAVNAALMGILLETCAPASFCRVGFGPSQPYRVQMDAGGSGGAGDLGVTFSATRCRVAAQTTFNDNLQAYKMQNGAISANAFAWIRFR